MTIYMYIYIIHIYNTYIDAWRRDVGVKVDAAPAPNSFQMQPGTKIFTSLVLKDLILKYLIIDILGPALCAA